MGEYIYRVTSKVVKLTDGRTAHVAKFAYKPYWSVFSGNKENARLHFKSGCVASENMTLKTDLLVTLDEKGEVGSLWSNTGNFKVFSDYAFGKEGLANIGHVVKVGKAYEPRAGLEPLVKGQA